MQELELPLFPLQVVLFPGSVLPLHIFEERYKQLINECDESGNPFGINLVHNDILAPVGCTARVTAVKARYDDGKMDIVVQGGERYKLLGTVDSPMPYAVGRVEMIGETSEQVDPDLVQRTIALHNTVITMVYNDEGLLVKYNPDLPNHSYSLVLKAGMELEERQQLMELDSETARLEMLEGYFNGIIPKLELVQEVDRIIKSDGYLLQ